jgi:hypothetical protein
VTCKITILCADDISLLHTQSPSTQFSYCEVLLLTTALLGIQTSGNDNEIITENSERMIIWLCVSDRVTVLSCKFLKKEQPLSAYWHIWIDFSCFNFTTCCIAVRHGQQDLFTCDTWFLSCCLGTDFAVQSSHCTATYLTHTNILSSV